MEGVADSTTSEKFWLGNWAHSVMNTHFDCELKQQLTTNESQNQCKAKVRDKNNQRRNDGGICKSLCLCFIYISIRYNNYLM